MKSVRGSSALLLTSLALLIAGRGVTANGIDSVTAFEDGRYVTIHGSGFGTKSPARPLYFWDFGNSITGTSSFSRLMYTGKIRGFVSTTVIALGSTTSLQVDLAGDTSAVGPQDGVSFDSPRMYAWIKRRYEFNIVTASGPNGFNLKSFRLWDPWIHDMFVNYQGSNGGTGHVEVEHTQNERPSIWFGKTPIPGSWVIEEFDYQSSTVGRQDGVLLYIRNGIAMWEFSARFSMRTTAYANPYNRLFFDQVSNNRVAPGTFEYIDSIYVDDSRQRVILSDEPTWRQVTSGKDAHREIQIPLSWTDSRIEIAARKGSFDSGAGKYLYVIDSNGQPVSTQGFAVPGMDVNPATLRKPVNTR